MPLHTFAAFDAAGAPLAGLAPEWLRYVDAVEGVETPSTSIPAVGGGLYAATVARECAGIVDLGASALPRCVFVGAVDVPTVAVFGADGLPLAGVEPTWLSCSNATTGAAVDPLPTFTDLGGGLWRIDGMPAGAGGVLDLGASANPRRVAVSVDDGSAPPTDSTGVPDADFAAALAAASAASWRPLVHGTDLFRGPVRPQGHGVPHEAVFVLGTGGVAPRPYLAGSDAPSWRQPSVQVRIRSDVGDYDGGLLLARLVVELMHAREIAGWTLCYAVQSEPSYLGRDDAEHHEWSCNFRLGRSS